MHRTADRSNNGWPYARLIALAALFTLTAACHAQVSFTTAIDLALKASPRVKMAQAEVARAVASHQEAKDVYLPSITANSGGLGYGYGFPLSIPTVYTVGMQSLVFNFAQGSYIRSTAAAIDAANLSLKDVREQVAEDTANTYIALDEAQQKRAALAQEARYAEHLQTIVKDRLDAGLDNALAYTQARRTGVQIRLLLLQLDDEIASETDHLARLIGLPATALTTDPASVPAIPTASLQSNATDEPPAIKAAFLTAKSKREQAVGDGRYILRPQLGFGAEYARLSTYNNSYIQYYPSVQGNYTTASGYHVGPLSDSGAGFSVNITLPIFDAVHRARARQTMADAVRLQHSAEFDLGEAIAGRLKLQHSVAELAARSELAALDRDIAQEQLDAILTQLQAPTANTPAMTPKEEQNARILERQRFVDMLDNQSTLDQARISLLRQTGELEDWLKSTTASQPLQINSAH